MEYNRRNPAVKRLMKEAEELRNPTEEFEAYPMQDNLFEWHFTLKGPANTDFSGGLYHGRIILPPDYPMKPPNIMLLTPNGRFEVNKKICLSISGHHPESWQPSWSIRTALLAIIGFMPTHGNGAIGSLDYSPIERQKLAVRSQNWQCPECRSLNGLLPEQKEDISQSGEEDSTLTTREEKSNPVVDSEQSSDDSADRDIANPFRESDLLQPTDLRNRVSSHLEDETIGNLQVSEVNTQKSSLFDSFSTICIWVILLILTVLLFRRLLFV